MKHSIIFNPLQLDIDLKKPAGESCEFDYLFKTF